MVTNVPTEEITIQATAVSPGIAIGRVYPLRHKFNTDIPLDTPVTEAEVAGELARFHRAQDATRSELQQLKEQLERKLQNGDAGIFDAHLLIVDDRGMTSAVETMIRSELKNADYAFFRTSERYAAALAATDDKYLQERAADIRDVSNRIRRHLQDQAAETSDLPDRCIIAAPDLTPSETAGLDKNRVLGFAVETGSAVSHTAILARSMRIPAVTGVPRSIIEQLSAADTVIIDGFHGRFILHPDPRTEEAYRLKAAEADKVFSSMRNSAMRPEMKDGFEIQLSGNIESAADLSELRAVGAWGVGLMRSEYLFNRPQLPDEETQLAEYREILSNCSGQPVVIRTLDVGGDKFFSAVTRSREQNPFLGLRGVRLTLREQQDVFRTQLRALLRAGVYGDLRIMLPMITNPAELDETRELIKSCQADLAREGKEFVRQIMLGAMIETPAAALTAHALSEKADFFSIGTNDLTQYTLAIDRSNDRVSYLYAPSHPAVLKLIALTADAAAKRGIPVCVCGQMAGDPRYTALLAGLGVHELSMDAGAIGGVRRVLRGITMADARQAAAQALAAPDAQTALQASCRLLERSAPDLAALL